MIDKIELDFGVIYLYDKILVSELNEGVLLDVENNKKILQIGHEAFPGEAFGYISNRIHSYAVNPLVYRKAADDPQLKAIAVVTTSELSRNNAILEQNFYADKNYFQIFNDLKPALNWIRFILENQSTANPVKL
jgi:hypothetical protein